MLKDCSGTVDAAGMGSNLGALTTAGTQPLSTSHFSQLHELLPHPSQVFCYLGPGVYSKSSHLKLNDNLSKP